MEDAAAPDGPGTSNAHSVAWGLPFRAALLAGWLTAARLGLEWFLPAADAADELNRRIGFLTTGAALLLALAGTILLRRRGDDGRGVYIGAALRVGIPLATAGVLAHGDESQAHAAFGWMTAYFLLGLPVEVWLCLPGPGESQGPPVPPGSRKPNGSAGT